MADITGAGETEMRDDDLADVNEIAEFLHLSPGTVYHLISQERIPFVRLSARCVRFRRSDVEAWIAEKCVPPVASDTEKKKSR
jgi:excisionase family DNA binding protein